MSSQRSKLPYTHDTCQEIYRRLLSLQSEVIHNWHDTPNTYTTSQYFMQQLGSAVERCDSKVIAERLKQHNDYIGPETMKKAQESMFVQHFEPAEEIIIEQSMFHSYAADKNALHGQLTFVSKILHWLGKTV